MEVMKDDAPVFIHPMVDRPNTFFPFNGYSFFFLMV